VKHDVALVNQLGSYRLVVHTINRVMEMGISLQVLNVFEGAG
jgi:hypothetical protein